MISIHWLALVPWAIIVVWLVVRVVRMELDVKRGVYACNQLDNVYLPPRERTGSGDFLPACIPSAKDVGDVRRSINALARALGYEWKRTDAKEGWEKKPVNPFGFKPLTGEAREEAIRSIEHAINTTPNPFCSARIRYYESGDRRKADRRKPTPQAAPQAPRKKPRRAH